MSCLSGTVIGMHENGIVLSELELALCEYGPQSAVFWMSLM
jgi:hypothetical protein